MKRQIRFEGLRFKLDPKTKLLTAVQSLFTNGFSSPVVLLDGETAEDMQTIYLKPGQRVTRVEYHYHGKTRKYLLYSSDGSVFAELSTYWPILRYDVEKLPYLPENRSVG